MRAARNTRPLDYELAKKVEALDDDAYEVFQERAGIRQFDGLQSRRAAEAGAWEDTLRYLEQRNQRPE